MVCDVSQPSIEDSIKIVTARVRKMERHHSLRVLPEAVEAVVKLTHRYLPERKLPDKASECRCRRRHRRCGCSADSRASR